MAGPTALAITNSPRLFVTEHVACASEDDWLVDRPFGQLQWETRPWFFSRIHGTSQGSQESYVDTDPDPFAGTSMVTP